MDVLQTLLAEMKSASRMTDRKAAAQNLLEYLNNDSDEICQKLNFNSVNPEKKANDPALTWTMLFVETRDYFVKETEKGTLTHVNQIFYFSVLNQVFQKATCDRPWLQWNKVCDFIVDHLRKERHAMLYGPSLINMLERFLSVDLYVTVISSAAWKDIIGALLKSYKRYNICTNSLLRCLNKSIHWGSQHPKVLSILHTEVVNFYTKFVEDSTALRQDIIPYLEGMAILCNENAIEFRGILCKLGETVIPHILQIHSFTEDEEVVFMNFLLVQYRLHMPCDIDIDSPAFYADDVTKWLEIIKLLYSYCIDKIEDVSLKRTSLNKKDLTICEELLLLAAKCTKQVSYSTNFEAESSEEGDRVHVKKKMRYKSFHTIVSDLHCKPASEALIVWLDYLTVLLTNFPEIVATKTSFSNLIHLGTSFFNSEFMLRKEYYLYFLSLLKAEQYLINHGVMSSMSDTWKSVWDLAIKSLPVSENKSEVVNLLRQILKVVHPSNITPLLMLYMNNSMPRIKSSVNLLAEYLSLVTLPVQISSASIFCSQIFIVDEEIAVSSSPRIALIRWLINMINEDIGGYERIIATIMCSLIVQKSHTLMQKEVALQLQLLTNDASLEFEKTLLKCNFVRLPDQQDKRNVSTIHDRGADAYVVEQYMAKRLADAFKMDYEKMPQLFPTPAAQLLYRKFINKLSVYMNVLNVMEKYFLADKEPSNFRASMERMFDLGMAKLNGFLIECFATDHMAKHPEQIRMLIQSTRILFQNDHICDKLNTMLSHRINQQVQELLKKVFRGNLASYLERVINNPHEMVMFVDEDFSSRMRVLQMQNAVELDLLTRADQTREKASMEALRILIDYGIICHHRLEIFSELIKDLLSENFCSSNQFLFDACGLVISKLSKILSSPGLFDLIGSVIGILQKCCRGFFQLPKCSEKIWTLFKEMTQVVAPVENVNRQHFMILVGTLHNLWKTATSITIRIYKKAFEAFSELTKYDRSLTWTEFTPSNAKSTTVWVLEELHLFLQNESQQVRMYAVDTICFMYQNATPFDYSEGINSSQDLSLESVKSNYQERRKDFLDKKMFQNLLNLFDVDSGLSSDVNNEEAVNRTSLVLSCLTRMIFAFSYLQKQNVMYLFVMTKLKNIDVILAHRALQYASATATKTMCCYLPYVLKKWLKLKYGVEDLPYQFFGCENLNLFLAKFKNEICVEYFEQDKISELENFSLRFNMNVQDSIKKCYGLIMARLTPGLAIHKYNLQSRAVNLGVFNETHKRLIVSLGGKDATDTLMVTCLGDVVLNLISLTFEPSITIEWNCKDVKLAEPVPPHYPEATIETCLQFLKAASPHSTISVIGYLSKSSPQSIYKILLALTIRIHDAHDDLEKFWRLHQFNFFLNLLLKEPHDIFEAMKEFVCNFAFTTYLRLLKSDDGTEEERIRFQKVLILLITKLVDQITEEYLDEMMVFFGSVMRGIVSAVVKSPELMETAKKLLDYLLKSQDITFASCIESLDPFPSHLNEFNEYRIIQENRKYGPGRNQWTLQKEFEKCLAEMNNATTCCTKERLHFIRELLSQRKRDLDRMVRSLENKRFSGECEEDPLHSIIQKLVDVALSSRDEVVAVEACRCLGEIGPIDLSILVLPSIKNQGRISTIDCGILEIIKIISEYLISHDIRVVTVASKVLRSLLEFEDCVILLERGSRLMQLLVPFRSPQNQIKKSEQKIDANYLETKLGLNEMDENIDYKTWLIQLTTGIIECFKTNMSLVTHFLPLCQLKVDFSESVLPVVVYMCLHGGRTNPIVKRIMTSYFRNFFSKFMALNNSNESTRSFSPSNGTASTGIFMNKLALRSLIRVVQFLRRHPLPQEMKGNQKLTPWDSNFWLDLNYLDIARAAQYCGAYLSSILFTEIAATEMDLSGSAFYVDEINDEDSQDGLFTQGTTMYPRNRTEACKIEKLLLKAYTSIGEADAVFGCGSARFADTQSSMHHLEHKMDWHGLLTLANGNSFDTDSCQEHSTALSLKNLGLYNILWFFLKGVESGNIILQEDLAQVQYECGWRLTKWDLNTDKPVYLKEAVQSHSYLAFQMCIYDSIQAGLSQDQQNHAKATKTGYLSVQNDLKHATLESSENIYSFLSRLQMIRVVEDFFLKKSGNDLNITSFLHKWKLQDRVPASDFKYQEPVLFLRNVLLRAYDKQNSGVNFEPQINDSLLELVAKAREAGRLDFAESCATTISSGSSKLLLQKEFEIAMNSWARGTGDVARHIMSRLIKRSSHEDELFPALLLLYGEWLSLSHCERPSVIIEKYLQRSCSVYDKRAGAPQQEVSKAHITLAKYADAQYQNVTRYIGSDVFIAKQEHYERAKREEEQMKNAIDLDSKRSALIMRKQSSYDSEEIQCIFSEKKKFLLLALQHYLRGLKVSSEQDLLIFRAISLWLENGNDSDTKLIEETTRIFSDETMPAYKYIVVLHQLSARLGSKNPMMNQLLKDILCKCAEEHPYHTLPVLLTQASLHKDEILPKKSSLKVQLASRVQAAANIVEELKTKKALKNLVIRMETMWLALISLANIPEGGRYIDGVKKQVPNDILRQFANLSIVAVPTSTIPVLPSGNYAESVVYVKEFGNSYGLVGGINSPKKIYCRGSNGITYNMLLKGQDDLRQDAVMQQVFGVMNKLLQTEAKTHSRRLHIRTYKVIPLSQRTGLIEWVEDTQTFGDYLVGTSTNLGAHERYRSTDYKPMDCRKLMMDARNCGDLEKKYSTYMAICEHFKPVFRHFFFENFKEAGGFFEKRLAYIRSVATTSIVGYILGLGDRHVLNILIDKTTAEFIHIDLGVAFEQGRILPTPETVPFRLTRDVIDGMGISGVEGVFKKSCEMTMEVLRNNSEIILTVLQVLLYDPLYMWALTTDRVAKVQPSDTTRGGRKSKSNVEQVEDPVKERNNSAARVLLRLKQKLMGIEEEGGASGAISSGSSLSIDGHVSLLVQRAVDPEKLCRLFPGWQPYL